MNLYPVILAGGSGTRLWPLSRKNYPKQFLCLQSEFSLLQETLQRVKLLPYEQIVVVSNEDHYFLCQEQLHPILNSIQYLLEPCARNTAPAIISAALYCKAKGGDDAIMVIFPSDHWVGDNHKWAQAMLTAGEFASLEESIVTFGITPTHPETGYGYIEGMPNGKDIFPVKQFLEKPDLKTAEGLLSANSFYWNSGMLMAKVSVLLKEFMLHVPDIYQHAYSAFEQAQQQHNFIRLNRKDFENCRDVSVDYAVMEKTECAVVMPIQMAWNDLGSWSAVAETNPLDENGNTLHGKVLIKDSYNCLVTSENVLVTTIGIKDQIIVATNDAILVADKQYAQQVKDIVNNLPKESQQLALEHVRVFRPWGYYEVLVEQPTFKVKRLMIKPGAKLSLQMHQHRAEHWVVVEGIAEVINNDELFQLTVNQSTYIPQQTRHRLSNPGSQPLYVIEVQSGSYLGEDDITRFDDVYYRS